MRDTTSPVTSHPTPDPHTLRLGGTRTLAFLLFSLFLNLQGDGFHLGDPTSLAFQLRLLPFTLVFLALLAAILHPTPVASLLPPSFTSLFTGWRAPLAVAILFLALAAPLHLAQARVYARFGYHLHPVSTLLVFAGALLALTACLLARPSPSLPRLLFTVLASFTAISLLSLANFPLAIGRSDMLPLLSAANSTLLQHHDPYRLYTFPSETVSLTYLPGTLLAYLPPTLLRLDLRLVNLTSLLLLSAVLLTRTRVTSRLRVLALLACFLLGPYLLYRHELYTPPLLLLLTAALLATAARRPFLAAILFGLGVATSQFCWILLPFFLLHLLQTRGPRLALQATLLALLATNALVLPFFLADPHSFLFGTLSHWGAIGLTARPVNLSFFTARLVGPGHLQLVQAAVLLALFLAAVRTRACCSLPGTLRVMALAVAVFIVLNFLVWGYFFLLLQLLLLLSLLAAEHSLTQPSPSTLQHPYRHSASKL